MSNIRYSFYFFSFVVIQNYFEISGVIFRLFKNIFLGAYYKSQFNKKPNHSNYNHANICKQWIWIFKTLSYGNLTKSLTSANYASSRRFIDVILFSLPSKPAFICTNKFALNGIFYIHFKPIYRLYTDTYIASSPLLFEYTQL